MYRCLTIFVSAVFRLLICLLFAVSAQARPEGGVETLVLKAVPLPSLDSNQVLPPGPPDGGDSNTGTLRYVDQNFNSAASSCAIALMNNWSGMRPRYYALNDLLASRGYKLSLYYQDKPTKYLISLEFVQYHGYMTWRMQIYINSPGYSLLPIQFAAASGNSIDDALFKVISKLTHCDENNSKVFRFGTIGGRTQGDCNPNWFGFDCLNAPPAAHNKSLYNNQWRGNKGEEIAATPPK